jgi:hypothetical protein
MTPATTAMVKSKDGNASGESWWVGKTLDTSPLMAVMWLLRWRRMGEF